MAAPATAEGGGSLGRDGIPAQTKAREETKSREDEISGMSKFRERLKSRGTRNPEEDESTGNAKSLGRRNLREDEIPEGDEFPEGTKSPKCGGFAAKDPSQLHSSGQRSIIGAVLGQRVRRGGQRDGGGQSRARQTGSNSIRLKEQHALYNSTRARENAEQVMQEAVQLPFYFLR